MNPSNHSRPAPALILFGPPGSGKGTQAKLLRDCLKAPHISTGDMLRRHIEEGDEIGRRVETKIKAGKLVKDDLVNRLVEERLGQDDCRDGIILDGYPRTINQTNALLGLAEHHKFRLVVVHLVVDHEKIVARLTGRRQCPVCGTLYSLTTNPPKVAGICDRDGAALVTREDDSEPVIRERLGQYDRETHPILQYLRARGAPVLEIGASDAMPEQVTRKACEALVSAGLIETVVAP